MATFRDLRKTVRENLNDPRLAVVFFETANSSIHHFANIINLGVQGVLIESDKSFQKDTKPKIMMKNPELDQWDTFFCRVAWTQITESEKQYKTGLELLFPMDNGIEPETDTKGEITPQDIEFLLNSKLLKAVSKDKYCSLLNCMSRKVIDKGIPFVFQEKQNGLYIIQKGLCTVKLKNKSKFFKSSGQKRKGDIIGEMAFFSAKTFISEAVSESEMVVWELPTVEFDSACQLQPGLILFLTGLLTSHFGNPTDTEVKCIGRYILTNPIGEGKTSFVYKGRHKQLNTPVVIKMIKHHQTFKKEDFNALKKRINRLLNLNHPNIAQIYDIEEQYRTVFIIMEHIDGDSLESILERETPLSSDNTLFFLAQTCSALAHAHDQKIIHRHLTPSNIFISEGRDVVISDFGIDAPTPEEDFIEDKNIYYMAPEQIKGGKTDFRSDIYSLGILTYKMLTGQTSLPWKNFSLVGMNMNSAERIHSSSVKAPDLPEYLKNFILKACATSPNQRYDSVHDIIEELSNKSSTFKEALNLKKDVEQEVSALLISHKKNQLPALFRLLDDFSQKALDLELKVNITGKIQTSENQKG